MKHMQIASAEPAAAHRSFYSVSEVAALLGVSRVSVWRWISAGRLPVSRLGHRTVRIRHADVERIVRAQPRQDSNLKDPFGYRPSAPAPQPHALDHFVLFYEAEPFLFDSVSDFIAPALNAGDHAVVIATPHHRARIDERLRAAGVDPSAAARDGRYVARDAAATLSRFMVDGMPLPARFEAVVGELLDGAGAGREVRVFGEMVALLVAEGNAEAALSLEALWNGIQQRYAFSLLCAYPMNQFGGDELSALLSDTCGRHSSVIPAEGYSALQGSDDRLREITALQQKAASLELEIAQRRRIEEQLERALVAERGARDVAEAALRLRDEFLSIASHELRTPITVLRAQAQLMLRRVERNGELDPERVVNAMRTVESQADKLARLVGQLLDVSRIDAGKLQLERRLTDVADLVHQVTAAAQSLTERHTINITAPASLECEVDPLRLEQVLTNLLDNAIKYSPDGGRVEVVLSQPTPDSVELWVRDFGLGIAPDRRAHIFERFYQAHDDAGRKGMGLGLYVSREIIDLHGGQLRAEFPDDGGTRFVVRLPYAGPPITTGLGARPKASIMP
jgi:excisionase family DNA binding protein